MSFSRSPYNPQQAREETIARRQAPAVASTVKPLVVGRYGGEVRPVAPQAKVSRADKVRQPIRESARGEECAVRLPGVCTHDAETTIWSHYRGGAGGKGLGTKAVDLAGCYACAACDAVYDGQQRAALTRDEIEAAWALGHFRSLVRLAEKGLL